MFWGGFFVWLFYVTMQWWKKHKSNKTNDSGGAEASALVQWIRGFHFSVILSFILHRQTGSVPFSYFLPFQRHKHALNQIEWMEVEYLPMTTGRE